jgi:uncharacterized tellurite resistance protein B-like protein
MQFIKADKLISAMEDRAVKGTISKHYLIISIQLNAFILKKNTAPKVSCGQYLLS